MTDEKKQTMTARSRDPWAIGFAVCAVALLLGGFLLTFTGVGAELGQERTVIVTVRAVGLPLESLGRVKVGDPLYSEPAGIYIGRVIKVVEGPMIDAQPDASGILRATRNPVKGQMDVTISTTGRRGKDVTAVGTQVTSIGQRFAVYTPSTFIDGTAVSIDVR